MLYILISALIGIFVSLKFSLIFYVPIGLLVLLSLFVLNKKYFKPCIIFFVISIIFATFTGIKVSEYDFKYKDKMNIEGVFLLLSFEEENEYYNKYICKNELGDKFILQIKKGEDAKISINNKISLNGIFKLPDLNRNKGGFNYRRFLN